MHLIQLKELKLNGQSRHISLWKYLTDVKSKAKIGHSDTWDQTLSFLGTSKYVEELLNLWSNHSH